MKKVFLFSSRLRVYLSLIPVLSLLGIVISVHDTATSIVKYYPLEIALGALAVLIVLYFFRAVLITKDEIRQIGPFTNREKAMIDEGKSLVFTLASKKRLTVELYGGTDSAPSLPWAGDVCSEINLFRAKTLGTAKAVRATLLCFGVCAEDADAFLSQESENEVCFENVAVRAEQKHDVKIYRIRILKTI